MPEIDLSQLGSYALMVLIPGIVESAKEHFGIQGKWAFVLSVVLGCAFVALGQMYAAGLIPGWLEPWLNVFIMGLSGGLAAGGYYDLLLKPIRDGLNGG